MVDLKNKVIVHWRLEYVFLQQVEFDFSIPYLPLFTIFSLSWVPRFWGCFLWLNSCEALSKHPCQVNRADSSRVQFFTFERISQENHNFLDRFLDLLWFRVLWDLILRRYHLIYIRIIPMKFMGFWTMIINVWIFRRGFHSVWLLELTKSILVTWVRQPAPLQLARPTS